MGATRWLICVFSSSLYAYENTSHNQIGEHFVSKLKENKIFFKAFKDLPIQ